MRDARPRLTRLPGAVPPATYAGTTAHAAWQGSQHDRAMQIAGDRTVLGDFADARFTYSGTT